MTGAALPLVLRRRDNASRRVDAAANIAPDIGIKSNQRISGSTC
jgi:hypothetical protein